MKRALSLSIGLLAVLAPIQAEAQLYDGSVTGGSAYLNFVSGSGVGSSYGVQVGGYTGNFAGDSFGDFSIYCVDFLHYATSGNVVVSQMSGGLGDTRLGGYSGWTASQARTTYQKAAYLASLFDTSAQSAWGDIHGAIWALTSGQSLGDPVARQAYIDMADQNYASVDLGDWYVISPTLIADGYGQGRGTGTYDGRGQEFLMRRVEVPEPATIFILLTGFVMLIGVSRKRTLALQDV